MRIQLTLVPNNGEQESISIPLDFRRYFISILKTLLYDTALYSRFEESQPGYSPYVFKIHFKKILAIHTDTNEMIIQPPVYITISSGFYEVTTEIINSAIANRGKPLALDLDIQRVELLPVRRIIAPKVLFGIGGHAAFRGVEDYLDGSNVQLLEESINQHMIAKYLFFQELPFTMQEEYKLSPICILEDSQYKKGVSSTMEFFLLPCKDGCIFRVNPQACSFCTISV